MPNHICVTCGTQYAEAEAPPAECAICRDERQYVGWQGQQWTWTTRDELRRTHRNTLRQEEPGLVGVGVEPSFAIGQRALLVRRPGGNVLWDCVPLLDPALAEAVRGLGGVAAVAVSHPHYYGGMVDWAREFGARVLLHAADRRWVMRPDPAVEFWDGETREVGGGLTLIRCGGHFEGGTVLHVPGGGGVLLSGDIIQVVQDRRWVSFMYSYPNLIPLPAESVRRAAAAVEPFAFDRLYGAWWGKAVLGGAKEAVRRSAERYIRAVRGDPPYNQR